MGKRYIAFDFETFLIGTEYPEPHGYQGLAPIPVCMSCQELIKGSRPEIMIDPWMMSQRVKMWLTKPEVVLIGQNVAFDLLVAVEHLDISYDLVFQKYHQGGIRDTMVRELLLALANGEAVRNPAKRYSMEALVKQYLGKDISADKGEDAWRMRYSELYGVPLADWPDEAVDYPLADARQTLQIFVKQHAHRALFESNELAQTRAAFDLHLVSFNSPRVDPDEIERFEAVHAVEVEKAQAPMIKAGLLVWNKNRHAKDYGKDDPRRGGWSMDTKKYKRAIEADYKRQGREVPLTDTGSVSTAAETLLGCRNGILRAYGEAATDIKLVDAFVPMLRRAAASPTRRVLPRYSVILKTGRTSCSAPNLQQSPKAPGARECFIPPEGSIFVAIDFNSMEMYCLGQTAKTLYGSTALLEALNGGQDPHLLVVQELSGMSYDDLSKGKKAKDPKVERYRALGKIANFGFGGGMGADTTYSNMSQAERDLFAELFPDEPATQVIKRLIRDWKHTWELVPMFEKAGRLCQGGNRPTWICPTTGRQKALNTYCQFCNAHFQPIAADAMKEAMARITESCYIEGRYLHKHGVRLEIEIHDEFVLSGKPETVEQWVPYVQQLMKEGAEMYLPDCSIGTEAEICPERWSKKGMSLEEYVEMRDE